MKTRRVESKVRNPSTGHVIRFDVHYPEGAPDGSCPVVFLLHGFMHNRFGHRAGGAHLASHGFVVVVPGLHYTLLKANHGERVADTVFLQDMLASRGMPAAAARLCDWTRVGIAGHSAGGLTALLASAGRDVTTVVGLDPVFGSGPPWKGKTVMYAWRSPSVRASVLILSSPPQACNNYGDRGAAYFAHAPSAVMAQYLIVNSSHCDYIDAGSLCGLVCGSSSAEKRNIVRRYLTAWLRLMLKRDEAMRTYVFGAMHEAHVRKGLVKVQTR